jgi:cytoplasmic iron level regulating protein YaaA (DUF328/UPF0246 family)
MIILIHTSKTMRPPETNGSVSQKPELIDQARQLDVYLKSLTVNQISKVMQISNKLAAKTHELISGWSDKPQNQRQAIDSFLGDIYSGLQVQTWTNEDRDYANQHLKILSGLYGILKPNDSIYPYRFEMGYRVPDKRYSNLYNFWGDKIVKTLPRNQQIINLAANEYSKVITDYLDSSKIISPVFLTKNSTTSEPTFVVVHAKIARGAFAGWLIKNQIDDLTNLKDFSELSYQYDEALSTPNTPAFVCKSFGGLGLSVRLS